MYKAEDRVTLDDGRVGIIEEVIYESSDGNEINDIYCYEMKINGVSGCIVFPDEIEKLI